jgi:hypothetical protein
MVTTCEKEFASGIFPFCNWSSVRSNAPRTPLARCAQTESAEMRSSRSANMRMSCRSACDVDIKSASPRGLILSYQIRNCLQDTWQVLLIVTALGMRQFYSCFLPLGIVALSKLVPSSSVPLRRAPRKWAPRKLAP